jgi:Fe-S-cluster-containing hydrogenase component 2
VAELYRKYPQHATELQEEATRAEDVLRQSGLMPPARPTAGSRVFDIRRILDEGVMQGHEVLVIDTSICVDCNNCVEACERRHGYARLERRGLQLGSLLFPSACRHCEDPVCLLCSVNGIVREANGEIRIVTDNCIGCGACASRCPYGNIQMHDRDKQREKGDGGFNLLSMLGLSKKQAAQQVAEHKKDRIAVKCDLCAGYPYYACVHACPVGAAFRIDPVAAFKREDLLIGLEMKRGG